MQEVDVKVKDVEFFAPCPHLIQHGKMRRQIGFQRGRIQTERSLSHGCKTCVGPAIAAGEKRYVVAQLDQSIHQMRDDSLRPAIKQRRDRFAKRSNLRDLQGNESFCR